MKIWYVVRELLIALAIGIAAVQFMVWSRSKIDPLVTALGYCALLAGTWRNRRAHRCSGWSFWVPRA